MSTASFIELRWPKTQVEVHLVWTFVGLTVPYCTALSWKDGLSTILEVRHERPNGRSGVAAYQNGSRPELAGAKGTAK